MKPNRVFKWVLFMILGLAGIFYVVFLIGSVYEAVVFPQTPQKVTLARAVEMDSQNQPDFLVFDKALYVSITDAVWECASVKQTGYKALSDRRYTAAAFSDAKKTAVVFLQVGGFRSCQELKETEIPGVLQRVYTRPVKYQSDTQGLTVIGEDSDVPIFWFCTHCTPSEVVGIPIVGLLFPFALWGLIEHWKKS